MNRKSTKQMKSQRGIAMMVALLALLLLAAIGMGLMFMADTENSVNNNYLDSQKAYFAARAGVIVPDWLRHRFDGLEHDPQTHHLAAAAFSAEQVLGLVDHGVDAFHFYTLNRADLVYAICHILGLRPES